MKSPLPLLSLAASASATILWDGRLTTYKSATDFDTWTWSNPVGEYETYIFGNTASQTASDWLELSASNSGGANTATTVKISISADSTWNGGDMKRTELIPQTDQELDGNLFFHVSLFIPSWAKPDAEFEHQIVFWESHESEFKYGKLTGQSEDGDGNTLRFLVGGTEVWSVAPEFDTWYNFAIETNSDDGGLYQSTWTNELEKVYTGNCGSGGNQFHVGQLRLTSEGMTADKLESIYYAGVYVEDELTTTI